MTAKEKAVNKTALRRQCRGSLGRLGCYMFLEFSSLAQPRTLRTLPDGIAALPQSGASMLFRWTKAAILAAELPFKIELTRNESGLKALISGWQKMHRAHPDRRRSPPGLEFVVSSTMLTSAAAYRHWRGSLILVYERKTQSLFHHIVDVGTAAETPSNLIWFAISQAMREIENSGASQDLLSETRTVLFPSCLWGTPVNNAFHEASDSFVSAKKRGEALKVVWLKGHKDSIDTGAWEQGWYIGRTHLPIEIEMSKVNDLRKEMGRLAAGVSKSFRHSQKTRNSSGASNNGAVMPSWKKLNAVRATVRKSADRFDQ